MYCVYEKETYKAKRRNGRVILVAYEKKEGFSNYIDVVGNEHSDIFMKEVEIGDVELIYKEDISICYLGNYFELFAPITFASVKDNKYVLFTSSEEIAKEFEFEKEEQFVFSKKICKEQIDSIKITRKPIREFEKQGVQEIVVTKNEVEAWLNLIK